MFAGPQFSPFGKVIYAAVTLILMIIAYGANNIPYSALGGVISDDPDERVSVASWRMILAMLAAFFVLTFSLDMVERLRPRQRTRRLPQDGGRVGPLGDYVFHCHVLHDPRAHTRRF